MSRLVWLALWSWPAAADDFYVAPGGSDAANDCTNAGTPCATVAQALLKTTTIGTAPHTVHLANGEYESTTTYPLMVPGGVSLEGASRAGTILDGNGAGAAIVNLAYAGSLNGISGLTIRGGSRAIDIDITSTQAEQALSDLDLSASAAVIGIDADHADLVLTVDDAEILAGTRGISFSGTGALDLTLTNTTIQGASSEGIRADFAGTSTAVAHIALDTSAIHDNGQGILLQALNAPSLQADITGVHASIDDHDGPGIALSSNLSSAVDATLAFEQSSHLGGNTLAAIRLRGGEVIGSVDLDDSVISSNDGLGIFFDGQLDMGMSARATLVDSHIDDNGGGIVFSGGRTEPDYTVELTDSSIDGNDAHGVRVRMGVANDYTSQVILTSSTISGNGNTPQQGAGVSFFRDGEGNGSTDLVLDDSAISDNGAQGFDLECSGCQGSTDLSIDLSNGSEINRNVGEGVYASFGGTLDLSIVDSDVSDNGKTGVALSDTEDTDTNFYDVTLTDASFDGNGSESGNGRGFAIKQSTGVIESTITATRVSFDGNAGSGFELEFREGFDSSVVLDECTFDDNRGDADGADGLHVATSGDSHGTFDLAGHGVTFERNKTAGLRLEDFAEATTDFSIVLEDFGFFDNDGHGIAAQTAHGDLVVQVSDGDFAGNGDGLRVLGLADAMLDLDVQDVSITDENRAVDVRAEHRGTVLARLDELTIAGGQSGMYFSGGPDGIANVELTDTTITDVDAYGIEVRWSGDEDDAGFLHLGLEEVALTGAGADGVYVAPEGLVAIEANLAATTITDAGGKGMRVFGASDGPVDLTVRDSHVGDNAEEGIFYDSKIGSLRIEGSVVDGNMRDGVRAGNGVQRSTVLRNNTLVDNDDGYASGSYFDVSHYGNGSIDARENWWGTSDPADVADHVSGGVEYSVLPDALIFTPATTTGPEAGGTSVALVADDTSGPFHERSGDLLLTVLFGSTPSPAFAVSQDGRLLVAEVPPGTGTSTITVTNPGGQVGTASFTYVAEDEFVDADADGVEDGVDNCASVANVDQANHDSDATGDACDTDDDGDGVLDGADVCPTISDAGQADLDGDDQGDVCDTDDDGDTVVDGDDDCPRDADPQQQDDDEDGIGDACDIDADGNGIPDRDEVAEDTGGDDTGEDDKSCGCATESAPALWPALLGLLALRRRRR